jgi:hypothetical protein
MPLKKIVFAAAFFVLSACVTTPMPINNPPLDYNALPPVRLDVSELLIINDSSTTTATQSLAQYGQSPEQALREWAEKRIETAGTQGMLSLIVKDANFNIVKLPLKDGIKGWLERQQAERWDAYLSVMVSIEGSASQYPPAELTISMRSSLTLPEDASDAEKRQTYTSIINKLITLFDAEARKQMDKHFSAYYL